MGADLQLPTSGPGKLKHYEGRMTFYVFFACLVAANCGFIYGYDIGISGGVTSMDDFLQKFFPDVYQQKKNTKISNYCRYDSPTLQLFTSSLYLAGAFSAQFASYVTSRGGRKLTNFIGGVCCLSGAILNGSAQNLSMLIIGRIMLGIGVGFAYQAVPLYISEMALPHWRGFLNIMNESALTIGLLVANLINYGTAKMTSNGWRISLVLVAVPATLLTLGGIFLPDTAVSLVNRGRSAKGRKVLEKIRGVKDVDAEFEDLLEASNKSRSVKSPWRNLLQRRYRPQLVMALFIPAFQQLTGSTGLAFYAPVLFKSIGFRSNTALYSAVILGSVRVVAMWMAMILVDRLGRKILFYEAGIQMAASMVGIGIITEAKLGLHNSLDHQLAVLVVVLICVWVAGFDTSWAPLAWLVPSEIFPLEIRSAAQSLTVTVNFLFTFLMGQIFLTLFCHLKFGTFYFFAGWVVVMTSFVALLLPETKNIPLEEMDFVWRRHWFWRRQVGVEGSDHDSSNLRPQLP